MSGNAILTGAASLLLDIIPIAALIALTVAFLRGRHRCREEERTLRESIELFRSSGEEEMNGKGEDSDE